MTPELWADLWRHAVSNGHAAAILGEAFGHLLREAMQGEAAECIRAFDDAKAEALRT